jgi:hypothetical protein
MQQERMDVFICDECGERFFDKNQCKLCEQFDRISREFSSIDVKLGVVENMRGDHKMMAKCIRILKKASIEMWGPEGEFREFDTDTFEKSPVPEFVQRVRPQEDPLRRAIQI